LRAVHTYFVKHCASGSEYGTSGDGKISKFPIRKDGTELYNFDRQLDFDNLDEIGKAVYAQILERYN